MSLKLYKGVITDPNDANCGQDAIGVPYGIDEQTGRKILSIAPDGIAFLPGRTFVTLPSGKRDLAESSKLNSVFAINAILVDELYLESGCFDKDGTQLFDGDIVVADGRNFRIYYSEETLRWELVEIDPDGRLGTPVPLAKMKSRLAQKALFVRHG